ncbi:shikimate kinase, partial [Anaerospora hongkongensis]
MKNVVLIGFMGTGKTSTGRLLASRLGRPFVDIDRKFELECNMSVAEYFKLHGE